MFVYISSTAFVIVVTQKLVLQQSKNVTAKCTENLSPSPCILFSLIWSKKKSWPKHIVKFWQLSPLLHFQGKQQFLKCKIDMSLMYTWVFKGTAVNQHATKYGVSLKMTSTVPSRKKSILLSLWCLNKIFRFYKNS